MARLTTALGAGANKCPWAQEVRLFDLRVQTCSGGVGSRAIAKQIVAFDAVTTARTNQAVVAVDVAYPVAVRTGERRVRDGDTEAAANHRAEKLRRDLRLRVLRRRLDKAGPCAALFFVLETKVGTAAGVRAGTQ